jgi:hypothetical protein
MLKINLNVNLATGDTAYIEADSLTELNSVLGYFQSIGALRGSAPAAPVPADNPEPPVATAGAEPKANADTAPKSASADPAPETSPGKPKRQSKKAEKVASAGAAAPSAETEQTAPAGTAPATDKPKAKPEDVTAAVTALANATSLQVARGVLEQFGVKRAAELKPEQYDAFVAACQKAEAEAL